MKRWVLLIALVSASCDGVHDLQNAEHTRHQDTSASEHAIASGSRTVITRKSVPEYYADLTRCERKVSTAMGAPNVDDSIEALKRALKEHPHDKTIQVQYVKQDLAIVRQTSINSCLVKLGYLVR